jgi:signal transduction histidine kinase
MAAVVAHEVRNPLAGIRGGIQLLSSMLPESGDGQDFVREIVGRIDALNAVIEDLLAFARLREPKMALVDAAALLSDVVKGFGYDPNLAGVRWVVNIGPELTLAADANQLRSLLTNILLNAAQATPPGQAVEVSAMAEAGEWRITIRDHGGGIPPEMRERVFEPFYTTKHRGSGLGLPIARRIADAHGGSLSLDDAAGGGTRVTITLPITLGAE